MKFIQLLAFATDDSSTGSEAQIEAEWGERIDEFVRQRPNQGSSLAEVTTVNIIYELHRRGYEGIVVSAANPDDKYDINKQFSHEPASE